MEEDDRVPVTFKTTKERKRLGLALVALLDKNNLTEVLDLALDRLIDEQIPPELRAQLLQSNEHAHGEDVAPPKEEPKTQRPRAKRAAM